MIDSIFATVIQHKYGYNDWHSHNFGRPYLGISHIWACLITAVTLAKTLGNLGPDIFYKLLANTLVALRAGHLTPLINPI
jgi:hypothetical protein